MDVSRARIAKLDLNPIFLCVLQPERGFVAAAGGKALIIKETQVKVKCRSSSFACCCSSDIVNGWLAHTGAPVYQWFQQKV